MPVVRRVGHLVALGAALLVGVRPALAQRGEPGAALWSSALPAVDAAPLRAAIEASSGLRLLDPSAARARLAVLARPADDDPRAREGEAALREAREAYVMLRLDDARVAYGRALDALLASEQRAPEPGAVARVLFERALVALAAQKRTDARRDLLSAVAIDTALAPDPDVYGPPVFRALAEARVGLTRAATVRVEIDRAPADARVRLDGVEIEAGAAVLVRTGVGHLVVAERAGHVPRTQWLEPTGRAGVRLAIVLPEATGALLARQALDGWPAPRTGAPAAPAGDAAALVARALGATHAVEATRDSAGVVRLVLRDARTAAPVRSAEGGLVPWEARPYFVLAEALEGRVVEPPARAAAPSLAASLPSDVPPGETFSLRLTLRDPDARVRSLEARCGRAVARLRVPPTVSGSFPLPLTAPRATGEVSCSLRGLDAADRVVVALPAPGEELSLRIVTPARERSLLGRWWFWSALGVAAVGGVVATVIATQPEPDPRQTLRFNGP